MKTPSLEQMRLALLSQGGQPVKAPVSELGFYSPTHEAALKIQRKTGNAQAFLNDLRKGGASKEELEHIGIHDFLKAKPTFTREEVIDHVARNAPQVKAVVLGRQPVLDELNSAPDHVLRERYAGTYGGLANDPEVMEMSRQELIEGLEPDFNAETHGTGLPKYDQPNLVLPGGKNYREILLTLPSSGKQGNVDAWRESMFRKYGPAYMSRLSAQERQDFDLFGKEPEQVYRSSHWEQPNVLAHIRTNDRTDADGKKVLFVEEIQSDWGQEGKKKGFVKGGKLPEGWRVFKDDRLGYYVIDNSNTQVGLYAPTEEGAIATATTRDGFTGGVPSAPFVTNTNDWVNLALKHVMKRAAQEGYDRVAFVNGEQSANRYSLDKHLHSVEARPNNQGGYELRVTPKEGRPETSVHVPEEKLSDYVGKDMADRIASAGGGYFEGENLKVPHKGMRDFYDKLVPAQAQALLKKFGGGQMRPINIQKAPEDITKGWQALLTPDGNYLIISPDGSSADTADTKEEALEAIEHFARGDPIGRGDFEEVDPEFHPNAPKQQLGFDITPAMRQALSKPIPYAEGGVVRMADGGKVVSLPQMRAAIQAKSSNADILPYSVDDSTTLPIPPTFGGKSTQGRLFHGGAWEGPIADKQGVVIDGKPATSFTRNPYEALEYSQHGGKLVSVSEKGLNIYQGGMPELDDAYQKRGAKALADAGYDGVDIRAITGGGYNEVVLWNHHKAGDLHIAPVEAKTNGIGLAAPFVRQQTAASATEINPAERRARKAIDDLVQMSRHFGLSVSAPTTGSIHGILSDLDYYYGLADEVRELHPEKKARLRTLWDSAEKAAMALRQSGGKGFQEGGSIMRKADGGPVGGRMPTLAEMKMVLAQRTNPIEMRSIGISEAPGMSPKVYMAPEPQRGVIPPAGGAYMRSGMPVGGIDMSRGAPGQQMLPLQPQGPQDTSPGAPQPGALGGPQMPPMPMGGAQALQTPSNALQSPQSNILQMTPQGRALNALGPSNQITQQMAKGGSTKSVDEMKAELAQKKAGVTMSPGVDMGTRLVFKAPGSGGVQGINVPKHMWEGSSGIIQKGDRKGQPFKILGMRDINAMRANVYGSENRDPLTISQIGRIHKDTLDAHFAKPLKQQVKDEKEALGRLRDAGHIGKTANTLDRSEKLDTVRHEYDEEGRGHEGFASKGVAGHALYTSGHGQNQKFQVLNTCPGQTEGCGGGKDAQGVVDTTKGTCFAPVAEAQYPGAAVRRACHEQAKHDPAMTRDWILAHTGSLREAARLADKNNQRLLFRPNVVDETDTSSRHVIRHLNQQRRKENAVAEAEFKEKNPEGTFVGKPPIIANSYGKTSELHDPENGYYVTHSNVGPKVKQGREISENISRDKQRISNTILAANVRLGQDFVNEQGNKTPPKGSYMVTNVKRGSPLAKKMEQHIKYAKYWSTGREQDDLSPVEKQEDEEGHFDANGKPTTPEKAHYGHVTLNGRRYDYQKQHVLHPRLVNVPERKKNKKTGQMETVDHMIPTDSRFKDTEFLPKNRFKTKNGKEAGHILMTTPTESTSNLGHETSFTHHVDQKNIDHAIANKGEYEIDKPEDQERARGKEYAAPQAIQLPKTMKLASGGSVYSRHPGLSDDDFHAFPERNYAAQRHLAMRLGDDEHRPAKKAKVPVVFQKSGDAMRLELTRKGK